VPAVVAASAGLLTVPANNVVKHVMIMARLGLGPVPGFIRFLPQSTVIRSDVTSDAFPAMKAPPIV
jgi:hypothetical protein